MTWQIDKRIDFCYGHRVWTQNLNDEFCAEGENESKCKHMHGHEGSVQVYLESDTLDRGFVTDFKHLGWLKDFLNAYVDHKFIVDINDPAFEQIVGGKYLLTDIVETTGDWNQMVEKPVLAIDNRQVTLSPIAPDLFDKEYGWYVAGDYNNLEGTRKELLEGFLFVDFVPTSENLSKWIYEIVNIKMKELNVVTSRIEWWETPKSKSTYFGDK